MKGLLKKHPTLKPETFLDEWNMDLMNPPLDPRFQPCYVAEAIWQMNFSASPVTVKLELRNLSRDLRSRHIILDAAAPSDDENARLRPDPFTTLRKGDQQVSLRFEPYALHYWSFE